jgi:hypothetical protein
MSKHMRKMAGALAVATLLTGCSLFQKEPEPVLDDPRTQTKPEHAIILLFEAVQTADLELLKAAVVYPEESINDDTAEAIEAAADNALAKTAIKTLFSDLSYTLVETEQPEEGMASLTVEVVYPDLRPIIDSNFRAFAPKIRERLLSGSFDQAATAAIQSEIMWAVAADLIAGKAANTRTETIEVLCTEVEGKWKVAPDRPILNVCTANALDAIAELDFTQLLAP